jgi:hypothetical protein
MVIIMIDDDRHEALMMNASDCAHTSLAPWKIAREMQIAPNAQSKSDR